MCGRGQGGGGGGGGGGRKGGLRGLMNGNADLDKHCDWNEEDVQALSCVNLKRSKAQQRPCVENRSKNALTKNKTKKKQKKKKQRRQ